MSFLFFSSPEENFAEIVRKATKDAIEKRDLLTEKICKGYLTQLKIEIKKWWETEEYKRLAQEYRRGHTITLSETIELPNGVYPCDLSGWFNNNLTDHIYGFYVSVHTCSEKELSFNISWV